jgi:hypothetical protein
MNNEEVFVVMAIDCGTENRASCWCICDSRETAKSIIKKDTENGDIRPGATIESHVIQTKELI